MTVAEVEMQPSAFYVYPAVAKASVVPVVSVLLWLADQQAEIGTVLVTAAGL